MLTEPGKQTKTKETKHNSGENPSHSMACLALHNELGQGLALYEKWMVTNTPR